MKPNDGPNDGDCDDGEGEGKIKRKHKKKRDPNKKRRSEKDKDGVEDQEGNTPEENEDLWKEIKDIKDELQDPNLTPKRRRELQRKLRGLVAEVVSKNPAIQKELRRLWRLSRKNEREIDFYIIWAEKDKKFKVIKRRQGHRDKTNIVHNHQVPKRSGVAWGHSHWDPDSHLMDESSPDDLKVVRRIKLPGILVVPADPEHPDAGGPGYIYYDGGG